MAAGRPATALHPEFEAVLRACVDGLADLDAPLHENTDLAMLGIDSLTVVRLLVTVEDTFGVAIPEEIISFELFSSPGVLWKVISGLREEAGGR